MLKAATQRFLQDSRRRVIVLREEPSIKTIAVAHDGKGGDTFKMKSHTEHIMELEMSSLISVNGPTVGWPAAGLIPDESNLQRFWNNLFK